MGLHSTQNNFRKNNVLPVLPETAIKEYSDYMESDLAPSQAWGKRQNAESSFRRQHERAKKRAVEITKKGDVEESRDYSVIES